MLAILQRVEELSTFVLSIVELPARALPAHFFWDGSEEMPQLPMALLAMLAVGRVYSPLAAATRPHLSGAVHRTRNLKGVPCR